MLADIQDTRQTINSAYFVDLFMMLQNINTRSMPVEAVIEMKEEKLLMLGPVLERLNDEALNPLIDRVFSIMARKTCCQNRLTLCRVCRCVSNTSP